MATATIQIPAEDTAAVKARLGYPVLYLAAFLATFTFGSMNLLAPVFGTELKADGLQQSFILSSYTTVLAAVLILAGRLGDRFGRRRVLAWGLLVFAVASVGAGLSNSVALLIVARVLQGIGIGLVLPQILSTIQATSSGEKRTIALARYAAIAGIGTVVGQMASGALLTADLFGLSWRPVMFLAAGVASISLALIRLVRPTRSDAPLSMDLWGAILLGLALAAFIVSMTLFSAGAAIWLAVVLLLAAVVVGGLFARREKSLESAGAIPLAPPSLFRVRALRMGLAMNLLFFTGYGAFMFEFSSLTQRGMHYSGLGSGLAIVLFALAFVVTSVYLHRISRRLGKHTMLVGAGFQLLALAALAVELLLEGSQVQQWHLQIALVLLGAAQAVMFGPLINTVMSQIPSWAAGLSGGLFSTVQQLAFSLGVAVLGGLYFTLSQLQQFGFFGGFVFCLAVQILVTVLFGLFSWHLHRHPATATPDALPA
ncbi:MFS transporter [Arthrobacter russicus]|uniref:MFS family permease n=1 Tax=Arthrobacter russicus TaxID=172040 RepID=A0ABU1J9Q2_9MICC|nr:MFS transporter [Arthrobacter russicus]MDN5668965.1 MFS transporter [Renibacterium salmoninarum]MDR6268606.1 MFS family permease [Arthrobacter russicus]